MLLFLFSCNSTTTKNETTNSDYVVNNNGYVTIIISAYEFINQHQEEKDPIRKVPQMQFFNGYSHEFIMLHEEKNYKLSADTLIFYSFCPEASVYLSLEGSYNYDYYVQPGDTLYVDFRDDFPIVKSSNQSQGIEDYSWMIPDKVDFFDPKYKYGINMNLTLKETNEYYLNYYRNINNYVDSLKKEQALSEQAFRLAKTDIKSRILNYELDSLFKNDNLSSIEPFLFSDDNFIVFSMNYRNLITAYFRLIVVNKLSREDVFDVIYKNDNLNAKVKEYFLYRNLSEIENIENFNNRAKKFLSLTDDTIYHQLVADISPMSVIDSKELVLYDFNMNHINFEDLMNKHKGKVVYIDIWASWCLPCIATMPDAEIIRNLYKDKPVVFLYFAFQDKEKPWKAGVKKHNLDTENAESYMIASPDAKWVEDMGIREIPQYILYDKKGVLIDKKYLSPKDENLTKSLDQMISGD